jgi:hypothetical protein
MNLSVFRQQTPMFQLGLAACIKAATTQQDIDLILKLAMTTDKPVLIGLDGHVSIVKVYAEGDENLSFEALYDTALTEHDLEKMQRSRAASPDAILLEKFRVEMIVAIDCTLDIPLMLAATNHGDVRKRLRDLVNGEDPDFREALHAAIVEGLRKQDVTYAIRDASQMHAFVEEGKPTWKFLDPSE